MEPNTSPVATQPPVQPVTPPQPINPVMAQVPKETGDGSKKMVLWLIGGLIIIILVVGGIYLYLSSQQTKQQPARTKTESTPLPVTKQEENLGADLDATSVGDVDTQFSQLDEDLEKL